MNILDDASQDSLREKAAERLAKYREMRAEQFLGDGWPELPEIEPVQAKVDLGPAERLEREQFLRNSPCSMTNEVYRKGRQ